MKTDYETTYGRVIAGQPAPKPQAPEGDGWILHQTTAGHDGDGKPALIFTWVRNVLEQGEDEELTQ